MVNKATRAVDWEPMAGSAGVPPAKYCSPTLGYDRNYIQRIAVSRRGRLRSQQLDRPECASHELLFQINVSLISRH